MKTHQQRMLQALEHNLENWMPSLEFTWDQTVASNVGFVGSVWPGEVTARRRMHVNFQADYAIFKRVVEGGRISDRSTIYINFGKADAEAKFKQVLEFLCGL